MRHDARAPYDTPSRSERTTTVEAACVRCDGAIVIEYGDIIGSVAAKGVINVYDCPHCRRINYVTLSGLVMRASAPTHANNSRHQAPIWASPSRS